MDKAIANAQKALLPNKIVSKNARKYLLDVFLMACIFFILVIFLGLFSKQLAVGLLLISFALWLKVFLLEAFYRDYKFLANSEGVLVEAVGVATNIKDKRLTKALKTSEIKWILARLGVSSNDFESFFKSKNLEVTFENGYPVSFSDLFNILLKNSEITNFFALAQANNDDVLNATKWLDRLLNLELKQNRWWSKDSLEKVKPIGTDWSYGTAFFLSQNSVNSFEGGDLALDNSYINEQIEKIETVLVRDSAANVLLVPTELVLADEVLGAFSARISAQKVVKQLENKQLVQIDFSLLLSNIKTKTDFEQLILQMLESGSEAGNIVLVVKNLSYLLKTGTNFGSDVPAILDPYLTSSSLQFIAVLNDGEYHSIFEPNLDLRSKFETFFLENLASDQILTVLEKQSVFLEKKHKVFFTIGALRETVRASELYFSVASVYDKSLDIISEIAPKARLNKKPVIYRDDVLAFAGMKSGIPVGVTSQDEKQKLLNLEGSLHERVVGQDDAIVAISNSIRRARAGVSSTARPAGSFLFLGPTGVGKTETAKALAEIFFGSEDNMVRIDMSEYQSAEGLEKLIGSFSTGTPGTLSTILKEKAFGVVLLDEFEKTDKKVLDLFLQILDEGFFTDYSGTKINVRNHIFIATSNAASKLIFEILSTGGNLDNSHDKIIDYVVEQNIFKPELLNRFDGVILFHPLTSDNYQKIAELMLKKLAKRLAAKNISLNITPELINYVATAGADPEFGARPMNRIIQDKIENIIATKILEQKVSAGSVLTIGVEELK